MKFKKLNFFLCAFSVSLTLFIAIYAKAEDVKQLSPLVSPTANVNGANTTLAPVSVAIIHGTQVGGTNSGNIIMAVTGADGFSNNIQALDVQGFNFNFNGTTWDRARSNMDTPAALINLLTAAASTVNSADQINYNGKGVKLGINLTLTTGTLTIIIQGKDTISGQYYNIASSAALAAPGFTTLQVYPGITTTANVSLSDVLPRTWRVQAVVGVGGGVSATVGGSVIN